MKFNSAITPFIAVLVITILIRQLYVSRYHTWTGISHYCAKCGSKDCKCPKKEGYTTGCGCGA